MYSSSSGSADTLTSLMSTISDQPARWGSPVTGEVLTATRKPSLVKWLDSPLAWLDVFAEVSGIPFGDLGHVLDAEAGVRFIPVRFFTVSAGYRIFDMRVGKDDDSFAKLKLTGPFIGASFRF